ncbi:MAG TPA: hypothetical protein VGK33_12820 [Chloroflexota bacterium]
MTTLTGWRAALAIVAALVVIGLLIMAFFWLAVLASAIAAVAAFNVLAVPRLARRLHVPELAIVGALLVVLAAGGWLLGGPVAVAGGVAAWLIGVVVPRVVLRRYRQNLAVTHRGNGTIVDLERAPISAGASDDDSVVTYRRPQ